MGTLLILALLRIFTFQPASCSSTSNRILKQPRIRQEDCVIPCGFYNQLCCAANQVCYTDSNSRAQCSSTAIETVTSVIVTTSAASNDTNTPITGEVYSAPTPTSVEVSDTTTTSSPSSSPSTTRETTTTPATPTSNPEDARIAPKSGWASFSTAIKVVVVVIPTVVAAFFLGLLIYCCTCGLFSSSRRKPNSYQGSDNGQGATSRTVPREPTETERTERIRSAEASREMANFPNNRVDITQNNFMHRPRDATAYRSEGLFSGL